MTDSQWLMRIEGALNAHFKQADGTSRQGTDWAVGLKRGTETRVDPGSAAGGHAPC